VRESTHPFVALQTRSHHNDGATVVSVGDRQCSDGRDARSFRHLLANGCLQLRWAR